MSAYLKELDQKCQFSAECKRRATMALYNTHNAHIGSYCSTHAAWKLKQHRALERDDPRIQPTLAR